MAKKKKKNKTAHVGGKWKDKLSLREKKRCPRTCSLALYPVIFPHISNWHNKVLHSLGSSLTVSHGKGLMREHGRTQGLSAPNPEEALCPQLAMPMNGTDLAAVSAENRDHSVAVVQPSVLHQLSLPLFWKDCLRQATRKGLSAVSCGLWQLNAIPLSLFFHEKAEMLE